MDYENTIREAKKKTAYGREFIKVPKMKFKIENDQDRIRYEGEVCYIDFCTHGQTQVRGDDVVGLKVKDGVAKILYSRCLPVRKWKQCLFAYHRALTFIKRYDLEEA